MTREELEIVIRLAKNWLGEMPDYYSTKERIEAIRSVEKFAQTLTKNETLRDTTTVQN